MTATLDDSSLSADAIADTPLCGDAVCALVAGRSTLTRVWATDPLKILTPRTHGYARQIVLSSYGGGLLGGDHVALRAAVKPGAALLVTTQSAGKVYRTDGLPARQTFEASVDEDATLAVLPDAMCAFAGSRFEQRQAYRLTPSANLVWLDWMSSGRHGRGERWAMDRMTSRTTIHVGGRPLLRETLSLDAGVGEIGSLLRVGRFDCFAVLAMIGPRLAEVADAARAVVRHVELGPSATLLAADASVAGGAVFRILGPDVQTVRSLLIRLIAPLGGLLGQHPWERKW